MCVVLPQYSDCINCPLLGQLPAMSYSWPRKLWSIESAKWEFVKCSDPVFTSQDYFSSGECRIISEERSIWKEKFENTFHLPHCHRNTKDIFFRESGEFSNLSDCLHQSGWVWVKALFKTIQGFVPFNRGREEFIKGSFNFSKTYFEYWECPGVWAGWWDSRFLT